MGAYLSGLFCESTSVL